MRPVTGSVILAFLVSALSAQPRSATQLGIYHWGAGHSHSVNEGVTAIVSLGGHVARVALSPRYYRDYHIAETCYPNFTLTAAAQEPDFQQAFDQPAMDVYILTTYDGASFGDCQTPNFLNPAFFTPSQTAAVVQEYSDFTLYLSRRYHHTHKRFILSNWEADNAIYCGQAARYAGDADFREACRSQYPAAYGIASPEDALQGLTQWLNARARGMADGQQRALAEGIGGKRVYSAPEFNIVRTLHDHGFPSVLYDVLPSVMFDYVSYSAWESLDSPDPARTLWNDLETVQNVVGSSAIIVGESGFLRQSGSQQDVVRTSQTIDAALAWGAAYVIQWQLYDTDARNAFGLFDLEGRPTPLRDWFQLRFQQANAPGPRTPAIPPVPRTPAPRN